MSRFGRYFRGYGRKFNSSRSGVRTIVHRYRAPRLRKFNLVRFLTKNVIPIGVLVFLLFKFGIFEKLKGVFSKTS
jgi:hypothetical protein